VVGFINRKTIEKFMRFKADIYVLFEKGSTTLDFHSHNHLYYQVSHFLEVFKI
jgi:hypothetical protein